MTVPEEAAANSGVAAEGAADGTPEGLSGQQTQDTPQMNTIPVRLQPGTMRNIVVNTQQGTLNIHIGPSHQENQQQQQQQQQQEQQQEQQLSTTNPSATAGAATAALLRARRVAQHRAAHRHMRRIPLPNPPSPLETAAGGGRGAGHAAGAGAAGNVGGGGQHIRIVTTNGRGPGGTRVVPWHTTNTTIRRADLGPLQPRPVPMREQLLRQDSQVEQEEKSQHEDRYKCPICYEFLRDPATCGSCETPFCYNCIARVASSLPTPAKCPTCRSPFVRGVNQIVRQDQIREEMAQVNTVPCSYAGCPAQLQLSEVAQHEQVCGYVVVKCRYASFGCNHKGLRKDLNQHEATCPLVQVSSLVEQFRQFQANQEHNVAHLQQRVAASHGMMEVHSSLVRRMHKRPMHFFDMADLVYTVACTPSQFFFAKDVWRLLHASKEARGVVANGLTLLPTFVLVLRIAASGFRTAVELDLRRISEDDVDSLLLSACVTMLGATTVMMFFLDSKSSLEWSDFSVGTRQMGRLWKHIVTVALVIMYGIAHDMDGRGVKAWLVWLAVGLCTVCFPAVVVTILDVANNVPRPPNEIATLALGRAFPRVLFGWVYGTIASVFGVVSCVDGRLVMSLLRRKYGYSCMCCHLLDLEDSRWTKHLLAASVGFKAYQCAMDASLFPILSSVLPTVLLLVTNDAMRWLQGGSYKLGVSIAEAAKADLMPHQTGFRREYSGRGMVVFGVWTVLMGVIALSY